MCSPIGTSPPTLRANTVSYTIVLASRARVGARAEVTTKFREGFKRKNILFSYTVLVLRARVGARAEVTKNDLGNFFFQTNQLWGVLEIIL